MSLTFSDSSQPSVHTLDPFAPCALAKMRLGANSRADISIRPGSMVRSHTLILRAASYETGRRAKHQGDATLVARGLRTAQTGPE